MQFLTAQRMRMAWSESLALMENEYVAPEPPSKPAVKVPSAEARPRTSAGVSLRRPAKLAGSLKQPLPSRWFSAPFGSPT